MGTTPGAQQSLQNTMLALARLDEVHNANVVAQAAKQESIRKRQEDVMAAQEKSRQTGLATQTQQLFGVKDVAEAAPFTQNLSRAYTRGAEGPTPITGMQPEETTPGGFKIPATEGTALRGLVSRPYVEQLGQQAVEKARQESMREAATEYGIKPESDIMTGLRERLTPILPGAPLKAHIQNITEIEKGKIGLQRESSAALKEGAEATVAQRTVQPRVTTAEEQAKQEVIKTRVAETDEAYHEPLKRAELATKNAEAWLKQADVQDRPEVRKKALADLQHVQMQTANLRQQYNITAKTQALIDAVQKAPVGSPQWEQLGGMLATQQGHHAQWFKELPQAAQIAHVNGSTKIADLNLEAFKQATAGNIEPARALTVAGNRASVELSNLVKDPFTTVTSVVQQPGGLLGMGKPTGVLKTMRAPTNLVQHWNDGNLEKVALGEPIYIPNPRNNGAPMRVPEAIEALVRFTTPNDSKALADAVAQFQGPSQKDKDAALQLIMQNNPAFQNVSTMAQEARQGAMGGQRPTTQLPTSVERARLPEGVSEAAAQAETAAVQQSKAAELRSTAQAEFLRWLAPQILPRTPIQLSAPELENYRRQYEMATR